MSSADCLRKLNHALKVGQLYRSSEVGFTCIDIWTHCVYRWSYRRRRRVRPRCARSWLNTSSWTPSISRYRVPAAQPLSAHRQTTNSHCTDRHRTTSATQNLGCLEEKRF